jgi:hypothetical protein
MGIPDPADLLQKEDEELKGDPKTRSILPGTI